MGTDATAPGGSSRGVAHRKRRRAVHVSDVDRRRLERGLDPAWVEKSEVGAEYFAGPDPESAGSFDGAASNDKRLREDVPPHW